MIEVNVFKRLLILGVLLFVALGVLACTREKPLDVSSPAVAQAPTSVLPATSTPVTGISTPTPVPTLDVPPPPTFPPMVTTIPLTRTPTVVATPTVLATATATPLSGTPTTYIVQWGDWLRKIAEKHNVTVEAILAANPGINPNVIYPGQTLNIPAPGGVPPTPSTPPTEPTTYTVQRGEWLTQIARKFGLSVNQLLAANPGINPNLLRPGQVLRIPAKATPVPSEGTPTPSAGGATTYTVRAGDTLYAIAVRFKTTPLALQIANNLANPHAIYPGMVLIIPAP